MMQASLFCFLSVHLQFPTLLTLAQQRRPVESTNFLHICSRGHINQSLIQRKFTQDEAGFHPKSDILWIFVRLTVLKAETCLPSDKTLRGQEIQRHPLELHNLQYLLMFHKCQPLNLSSPSSRYATVSLSSVSSTFPPSILSCQLFPSCSPTAGRLPPSCVVPSTNTSQPTLLLTEPKTLIGSQTDSFPALEHGKTLRQVYQEAD